VQQTATALEYDPVLIRFCDIAFEPLPSGALYWPDERTLIVADLHLEKMSSFAARGQLLPPYDTGATLRRLAADVAATGAERLIALGDSFHRNEGPRSLQDLDRARIDAIAERCEWLWLSGNHDPAPHALAGTCLSHLSIAGLTLAHEPRRGTVGLVAGHLHPAARIVMNGRSVRSSCFVHDGHLMILPAYGASTGSLNILSPAFAELLQLSLLEVAMLGRQRVYPVSPRRLVGN
jgi:DNA ligase-associated metallophosphoesterase